MKSIFLLMASVFIAGFIHAQSTAIDTSKLKIYVGKEGLDTMTVNDFMNYGKVEVNSPVLQVRGFILGFVGMNCVECEMATAHFHGNTFGKDIVSKNIKSVKTGFIQVSITNIVLVDANGKETQSDKECDLILKLN